MEKSKKIFKLYVKSLMITLVILMQNIYVFATVSEQDVISLYSDNAFVINIVTVILFVISGIVTGWELMIHRKNEEERTKTISGIPYIIGGIIITALTVQIATRMWPA
jgi:uncharacterized membrane protein HdeD (DUF308 family)